MSWIWYMLLLQMCVAMCLLILCSTDSTTARPRPNKSTLNWNSIVSDVKYCSQDVSYIHNLVLYKRALNKRNCVCYTIHTSFYYLLLHKYHAVLLNKYYMIINEPFPWQPAWFLFWPTVADATAISRQRSQASWTRQYISYKLLITRIFCSFYLNSFLISLP